MTAHVENIARLSGCRPELESACIRTPKNTPKIEYKKIERCVSCERQSFRSGSFAHVALRAVCLLQAVNETGGAAALNNHSALNSHSTKLRFKYSRCNFSRVS
eukprot:3540218-Amphidinium_carterae.1